MTFHHKTAAYVEPHECIPPGGAAHMSLSSLDFGLGSIWQCDECGMYWELQEASTDYMYVYDCIWRELTKRAARGRLRKIKRREQSRTVKAADSSS